MDEKTYQKVGVIGRFKPLHNGHVAFLERLCTTSEHVLIGIGSSNRYDAKNPFTAQETATRLHRSLGAHNYSVLAVPDFSDTNTHNGDDLWRDYVVRNFGHLDAFVSGNPWVERVLGDDYSIVHPHDILFAEEQIDVCATQVREQLAEGRRFEHLVPRPVAAYLHDNNLVERYRREFGVAHV